MVSLPIFQSASLTPNGAHPTVSDHWPHWPPSSGLTRPHYICHPCYWLCPLHLSPLVLFPPTTFEISAIGPIHYIGHLCCWSHPLYLPPLILAPSTTFFTNGIGPSTTFVTPAIGTFNYICLPWFWCHPLHLLPIVLAPYTFFLPHTGPIHYFFHYINLICQQWHWPLQSFMQIFVLDIYF